MLTCSVVEKYSWEETEMYPQSSTDSVLSSSLFTTNSPIASRSVEFEMEKVFHAMEMGNSSC